MIQHFQSVWQVLYNFIEALIKGLDNVLIGAGLESLETYVLNIKILSDTPILTVDLYTVLIWACLVVAFFMIYKVFRTIIRMPFRFFLR